MGHESLGRERDLVLLGSTGSIGTQAADIVRRNPGRFRLTGLAAGGGNPDLLAQQALEFGAQTVAVASKEAAVQVAGALADQVRDRRKLPELLAGAEGVAELAARGCDVVL